MSWNELRTGQVPETSADMLGRVERAREIALLNDPRGLYAYCWCEQPSGPQRVLAVR